MDQYGATLDQNAKDTLKDNLLGESRASQLDVADMLYEISKMAMMENGELESYQEAKLRFDLRNGRKTYGNICIYKDDFAALATVAGKLVAAQDVSDVDELKRKFCGTLADRMAFFAKSRLGRIDGPHTNPAKALEENKKPEARTKTYLRQCFYSCDTDKGKFTGGTTFCFMNSVVNSVLASNNENAKKKLAGMFTESGFKLYDNNGTLQEHTYANPGLSKDGNISLYEQSLNNHFKLLPNGSGFSNCRVRFSAMGKHLRASQMSPKKIAPG